MVKLEDYTAALQIYIDKPQVVNRRTGGCVTLCQREDDLLTVGVLIKFLQQCTQFIKPKALCEPTYNEKILDLCRDYIDDDEKVTIMCRRYVSKQSHVTFPHEIVIRGLRRCKFIPVEMDEDKMILEPVGVTYSLIYNSDDGSVRMSTEDSGLQLKTTTTSVQWLVGTLLPRIRKWAESGYDKLSHASTGTSNNSMRMIDVEKYYSKYTEMKDKYGEAICEIWPECTDPLKFVYEDVAIACYLICLWEDERRERNLTNYQTFSDLGCGNGLLVYILTMEGYNGFGLDIRKRKIWDKFDGTADLRELSLDPVTADPISLFGGTDWLIGNHSDELTPWIPVMSARASRSCQFFLLPCCPHNFYSKYQRSDPRKSVYAEYLQFVCDVVNTCGFDYDRDSMRIPSTKKECIIGRRLFDMSEVEYTEHDEDITDMLKVTARPAGGVGPSGSTPGDGSVSAAEFIPRPQIELVRNCATVSYSVQSLIVTKLADQLLQTHNYMCVQSAESAEERQWNKGGEMSLTEVVSLYSSDTMRSLKAECGGLKTLLKNHHHIFRVVRGRVRLADFTSDLRPETAQSAAQYKTRLCWFYTNHPDGCVLTTPSCRYAHGDQDLRAKPLPQS